MSIEHEVEEIKREQGDLRKRQDDMEREQATQEERSRGIVNMYRDLKEIVTQGFADMREMFALSVTQKECGLKERNFDLEKKTLDTRLATVEKALDDHRVEHNRNNRQTIVLLVGWIFTIALAVVTLVARRGG